MKKFEYYHFKYFDNQDTISAMNALGLEGWEVIYFYRDDRYDLHIYAKRERS